MIKKILLSIILLYFLTLLETSFFAHFNFLKWFPYTIFLVIIVYNIIESSKKYFGIWLSVIGGFFLDIFSTSFIGFNILILLALSLFLKFLFRRYVRIPFFEKD